MNIGQEENRDLIDLVDLIRSKTRALRVNDIATIFNVSERQIYKLAAEKRIPSFRIGSSLRFDPATVAGWLRRKIPPNAPLAEGGNLRPFRHRANSG